MFYGIQFSILRWFGNNIQLLVVLLVLLYLREKFGVVVLEWIHLLGFFFHYFEPLNLVDVESVNLKPTWRNK
jgi:hypothetical protein